VNKNTLVVERNAPSLVCEWCWVGFDSRLCSFGDAIYPGTLRYHDLPLEGIAADTFGRGFALRLLQTKACGNH